MMRIEWRTIEEAKLAALKLREWTGERGVYSRLFDQHTTLKTDADWLFFNIEKLSDDPRLETAMSMMIAHAMQERASGRSGQHSITVLDECWSLLDSDVLAPEVVQLFRTARNAAEAFGGFRRRSKTSSEPRRSRVSTGPASSQCLDENHRAAAGRREPAGDSPCAESGGSGRDQAASARPGRDGVPTCCW